MRSSSPQDEMRSPTGQAKAATVELFAGIGCVTRGFERSGHFEGIALSDKDAHARETYLENHPGRPYLLRDVADVTGADIRRLAGGRELHGLLGCPPCQGFSSAGLRDAEDDRNRLLANYFRLLGELRPPFFVMENVPAVLGYSLLRRSLEVAATKYLIWRGVLNAALFGAPQTRQRAIVIGYRADLGVEPSPPPPSHFGSRSIFNYLSGRLERPSAGKSWQLLGRYPELARLADVGDANAFVGGEGLDDLVVVGDALGDLPPAAGDDDPLPYRGKPSPYAHSLRNGDRAVANHQRWRHGSDLLERLSRVPEGGSLRSVRDSRRYFSQAYARLHRRGLARTLTTNFHNPGSGRFLHYRDLRTITVREAARLQGIEDRIVFIRERSIQERLVGNAFPEPLAQAIASHIWSQIGPELVDSNLKL
jgi:DNA (cytosine-5)-methyltransferase 1